MCVWVEDADKLELDSKELGIVFENRMVSTFLNGKSTLGLAGIKGQGKTFLIKVKRKRVSEDPSVICVPKDSMVDVIDSSINIDRSLDNYLIDYNVWCNLWKFAICGAIINHPRIDNQFDLNEMKLKSLSRKILKEKNSHCSPAFYVRKLLDMNIGDFKQVLEDTGELFEAIREIHQSVYVFFDKLDQGFSNYAKNINMDLRLPRRSRNASFWQYAQYSLAEASYDIYANTAHHIKVIYTIRQEALIDSEFLNKDKARNINSYITRLEYGKSDLEAMYRQYIVNEEDKNLMEADCKLNEPSKAFVGYEVLYHGYIPDTEENVFDYIFRHSFKRPYDIMKICRSLYLEKPTSVKAIRHIVNTEANNLLHMFLHELEIFLPCGIEEIDRLIKMLPGNILNIETMKALCDTYNLENEPDEIWQCNQECNECSSVQPFSILYNLGLIGYLRKHETDIYPCEEFKNIGKSILELNVHTLPESKYYFLHPALSNCARDFRNSLGLSFEMNKIMLVGDGCDMKSDREQKVKRFVKKCLNNFLKERIFISSTICDLKEERQSLRAYIKGRGLHPIMSEHNDLDLSETQKMHSHDCCLDEVLKCKSFIFIIGKEYGGTYSGIKYRREYEEIKSKSEGKITEPSISLMEYYVARKNSLKCYAFISDKIDDPEYKAKLPENIQNEYKFLNHFPEDSTIKGNWISRYSSIDELLLLIKNLRFN